MWIESHQSIRNHPKIKKAARLAGINEFEMIGRIHCLWWWALDYAQDGDITKYSADDIESAIDWTGERGKFYNALLGCGFNGHCGLIERVDDVNVIIHDWQEYGGRLLEKREANKERMREKRALHVQRTTIARTGATEQTEQTEQTHIASDDADTDQKAAEVVVTIQKHRAKSERDQASEALEQYFVTLSGLPAPKWDTDKNRKASAARWKNPLLEIWELCGRDLTKAQAVIDKAHSQMTHDNLTISAPASVLEVAKSIYAKNGFHAQQPEQPKKVYR